MPCSTGWLSSTKRARPEALVELDGCSPPSVAASAHTRFHSARCGTEAIECRSGGGSHDRRFVRAQLLEGLEPGRSSQSAEGRGGVGTGEIVLVRRPPDELLERDVVASLTERVECQRSDPA